MAARNSKSNIGNVAVQCSLLTNMILVCVATTAFMVSIIVVQGMAVHNVRAMVVVTGRGQVRAEAREDEDGNGM